LTVDADKADALVDRLRGGLGSFLPDPNLVLWLLDVASDHATVTT
jgi:hypothetical protein